MDAVPINYLAVVVSAVIAMIIGGLWYGPLFGKMWTQLAGMTAEKMAAEMAKGMAPKYAIQAIGSLIMSFVLAHSIIFASTYMHVAGIAAGLEAAFWNWIGFIAPVTIGSVLWDGKPWKLWFLNSGYYLVLLVVMGAILGLWA